MLDSLRSTLVSVRKLLQRSPGEVSLLVETALLMSAVRLGLRFWSFAALRRWLESLHAVPPSASAGLPVATILWAVEVVSWRMPGGVKCLARALTTQTLLRRRGWKTDLRIGVAKAENGQLEAHAWVEHDGRILIGGMPGFSRFQPLPTLEKRR